mmetsp:Transcript_30330/g.45934  ORF Transcript_30330/g.45934 Transcript_30330/m.45934 type:complete len:152 (-) Transcript_30330:556-1011(-)
MFLQQSHLTPYETWTYYFSIYLPSIGFALPNTAFTETELKEIDKQARRTSISKCGFNRNTQVEILEGSSELGGAGFCKIYTKQGLGMTQQIVSHLRANNQAGTMAQIGIKWAQYASGMEYSIFEVPDTDIPHLDLINLKAFCKFLTDITDL